MDERRKKNAYCFSHCEKNRALQKLSNKHKRQKKLDEHFQMMIKSERQMTFICDVQGLRWKFWKEMSTFFSIFFSKFKKIYYTKILHRNK
jgi:hypothetical protein